jgi:hypothetical protein
VLEAVAGEQAAMGVAGAFVGCACCVAGKHGPRFLAGEAHRVALRAAARKPVLGERVPQLMRLKIREPGRHASVLDHLIDAARRELSLLAEPQPGLGHARG